MRQAKGGRPLIQVGFMRRFDPEYAELKRLLDSGSFGRTLLVHNTHRNKSARGPCSVSEMIVRDSLVHEVDVARWLFGEEVAPIQVISPAPTSVAAEGVVDPQVAIFHMAGGGIVTSEVFVNSASATGSAARQSPNEATPDGSALATLPGRVTGAAPASRRTSAYRFATCVRPGGAGLGRRHQSWRGGRAPPAGTAMPRPSCARRGWSRSPHAGR